MASTRWPPKYSRPFPELETAENFLYRMEREGFADSMPVWYRMYLWKRRHADLLDLASGV